jgi:hypothetical protein
MGALERSQASGKMMKRGRPQRLEDVLMAASSPRLMSSTFALFGAFDEAYWSMERGRLGGILGGGTTTPDRRARRP